MFNLPEENREALLAAVDEFFKDLGVTDKARKLLHAVWHNLILAPAPPPAPLPPPGIGFALAPAAAVSRVRTWAKETATESRGNGTVHKYLNVVALAQTTIELKVHLHENGDVDVTATDNSLEDWELEGETARAYLEAAAGIGMFDDDDAPPEAVVPIVEQRRKQLEEFRAHMAMNFGRAPAVSELERLFAGGTTETAEPAPQSDDPPPETDPAAEPPEPA